MSKTATIRTRIEPGLKQEVEGILAELGLTASEYVNGLRDKRINMHLPRMNITSNRVYNGFTLLT